VWVCLAAKSPNRSSIVPQAFWKGGRILYEGTVAGINDNETISINYHDGDYEDNVAKERIRPRLMVRVAKSAAAKTMAEQAKGEKKKVSATPPGPKVSLSGVGRAAVAAAAAAATVAPSKTEKGSNLKRKASSADNVVSPSNPKKVGVGKASANLASVMVVGEASATVRRTSSSSASAAAAAVSPSRQPSRANKEPPSKDPQATPYADTIQKAVRAYVDDDGTKVAGFLFRAHSSADPDVFGRLRNAREEHAELAVNLEERNKAHDKLVQAAEVLFAPATEAPTFCPMVPGTTSEEKAYSLQQSLASVLGTSSSALLSNTRLSAQIKGVSQAIDRAVGF
jgi:hypothetical protein